MPNADSMSIRRKNVENTPALGIKGGKEPDIDEGGTSHSLSPPPPPPSPCPSESSSRYPDASRIRLCCLPLHSHNKCNGLCARAEMGANSEDNIEEKRNPKNKNAQSSFQHQTLSMSTKKRPGGMTATTPSNTPDLARIPRRHWLFHRNTRWPPTTCCYDRESRQSSKSSPPPPPTSSNPPLSSDLLAKEPPCEIQSQINRQHLNLRLRYHPTAPLLTLQMVGFLIQILVRQFSKACSCLLLPLRTTTTSQTCWTVIFCATWTLMLHGAGAKAKTGGFRCDAGSSHLACLPDAYSKFELPLKEGISNIDIEISIDEVLRINDKDYSITFSCYFNVKWLEPRIVLRPEFGREQAGPGVNITNNPNIYVPTNLEFVKDLWLPNIFIYNLKTYKVIDVLSKLAGLWIGADHMVLYSQATHITFICPMRFDKFPLDTQTCKFQVGSYSYDDSKMVFITSWAGYSLPKTENSIALDYSIYIRNLKEEDSVFLGGPLGNFSLAGFEMELHRFVSTYIITYYLPSGLFVIVSWISFLIPMNVIPGRMALLVTLFLVLVNIFNTVTTNTPKAEGLTAIEAWMLACILFVFGALIEYAAILFKKQRHVSAQQRHHIKIVCKDNFKYEVQERAIVGPGGAHAHVSSNSISMPEKQRTTEAQLAEEYWRIDKFFLISFPILFFIFNIIYWLAFIL